ncbi:MAG TPA: M1 family aminopeptidase, partial [Gemmatimonadales bacterium]
RDTVAADSARPDSARPDSARPDSGRGDTVPGAAVPHDTVRRADARPDSLAAAGADSTPAGYKRLRIVARDVHHFGWSVSPDYRYEGGYYLRPDSVEAKRWRVWDSVAVHVLYRPGDEQTWGNGQVVARTTTALRWLEELYGPYAYPQMTVLHRIEPGGTEFPMMQMNGSPSQGLILHEGGHVFSYGILANNEWRAGWMDEGLTSYQTAWAQGMTPQERALRPRPPRPTRAGYAGRGLTPRPEFGSEMQQNGLVFQERAQPLATRTDLFTEYAIYSAMTYGRGEMLFAALRDAIGDEAFRRFLRIYYERWALRHVDEVSMRAAAEAAAGRDLGWFFEQWIHETGVVDYALRDVDVSRDGDEWVTTARIERMADYRHPMPLGVRVDTGWVIARGDPMLDEQAITVRTEAEPLEVRLDPHSTSPDWYAPNDLDAAFRRLNRATTRFVLDWPFLEQSLGSRYVTALAPMAWYSRPGGLVLGGRMRSNYQGTYDRRELGLVVATRNEPEMMPHAGDVEAVYAASEWSRLQGWYSFENPILGNGGRPLMGWSGGLWWLDGVALTSVGRRWDRSPFLYTGDRVSHSLTLTGSYPYERALADGRRWSGRAATDLTWSYERRSPAARGTAFRMSLTAGAQTGSGFDDDGVDGYARGEMAWSVAGSSNAGRLSHRLRLYAGGALDAPRERGLYLSARTPTETFANHFYRPEGGILSADDVPYIPLGGVGMRGYDPLADARGAVAVNIEEGLRLARFGPAQRPLDLFATLFADGALQVEETPVSRGERRTRGLYDAGVGLALRGRIFDREVSWRVDLPFWVSDPLLSVGERSRGEPTERLALRWSFSSGDLW